MNASAELTGQRRHDQDASAQPIPDLGVRENDARSLLLDHPAHFGQVLSQQIALAELGEVLDVSRQVQMEVVTVLDDLAGDAEQLQAIKALFALRLVALDDLQ